MAAGILLQSITETDISGSCYRSPVSPRRRPDTVGELFRAKYRCRSGGRNAHRNSQADHTCPRTCARKMESWLFQYSLGEQQFLGLFRFNLPQMICHSIRPFVGLGCGQDLRTAKAGIPVHHQRSGRNAPFADRPTKTPTRQAQSHMTDRAILNLGVWKRVRTYPPTRPSGPGAGPRPNQTFFPLCVRVANGSRAFDHACWYPLQQPGGLGNWRFWISPAHSRRKRSSVSGVSGKRYSLVAGSRLTAMVPLWMRS